MTKLTLLTLLLFISHSASAENYYEPKNYGSDSLYNPFSNFLSYTFDVLQLPDNFGTANFLNNSDKVFTNLSNPNQAIENEGGWNRFINRQVFPINSDYPNESYAALPNYALHLLGGGMVYRKDLEWFRKNDYQYAATTAITLAMTAEFIQEVLEKNTTADDDEIADIFIFRPLGIALFHNDKVASFIMKHLDPAIWGSLQGISINQPKIINPGIHYIYRPPITQYKNARLFLYTGLNNMIGFSHKLNPQDSFSWATGLATQRIDASLAQQAELKHSAGIFYDRNKSLLASLIFNDTGGNRFRLNLYPTNDSNLGKFGYFITQNIQNQLSAGIVYKIQFGIGFSS